MPDRATFSYTSDRFGELLGVKRDAMYVMDYGPRLFLACGNGGMLIRRDILLNLMAADLPGDQFDRVDANGWRRWRPAISDRTTSMVLEYRTAHRRQTR